MTMNPQLEREFLSFNEKIDLARLEEAKATQRTRELEYQKSRFLLDYFVASQKEQQNGQGAPAGAAPGPTA